MKYFLFIPLFFFVGCATRVYENGVPVLACYSDADYLKFRTPKGTQLEMVKLNNSRPTRVGLDGITKAGTAVLTGMAGAAIPH